MRDFVQTKQKGFERLQDWCLNNTDYHKKAESSDEMFGKTGEKRSAWRPDIFYLCFQWNSCRGFTMNNSADCLATFLIIQKIKTAKSWCYLITSFIHWVKSSFKTLIKWWKQRPGSDNVTEAGLTEMMAGSDLINDFSNWMAHFILIITSQETGESRVIIKSLLSHKYAL